LQPSKELFPLLEPSLPEPGEEQNLFALSHRGSNRERLRLHFLRRSNVRATPPLLPLNPGVSSSRTSVTRSALP
jgi:hypothetical protein